MALCALALRRVSLFLVVGQAWPGNILTLADRLADSRQGSTLAVAGSFTSRTLSPDGDRVVRGGGRLKGGSLQVPLPASLRLAGLAGPSSKSNTFMSHWQFLAVCPRSCGFPLTTNSRHGRRPRSFASQDALALAHRLRQCRPPVSQDSLSDYFQTFAARRTA